MTVAAVNATDIRAEAGINAGPHRADGPTEGLSDHALAVCGQCRAAIWDYATPNGKHVALEDAPGDYVIDGNVAFRSKGACGYRGHWDH